MNLHQDQQAVPASTVPNGYMKDAQGRLVPTANVKAEHLLEDRLVRELHGRAEVVRQAMVQLKADGFAEIATLLELLAEKHGAPKGGEKGNLTLTSYDGNLRILVAVGDQLTFGPELQAAKGLIDSCLRRWSEGGNANLQAIVTDAFDVGKEGRVRVDRILGLRRIAIDDPEWLRAIEAISDAVRVQTSKRYIRLYTRRGVDQPYVQLPLDIAKVEG